MAGSKTTEVVRKVKPFVMRWINETVGGGAGAPSPHDLNSSHHSGSLADSQAPQFLKTDGSRTLTGNLAVSDLVTIDGVDVSVFKSAYDTHVAATAHAGHAGGVGVHTHQSNPEGGQLDHGSALTNVTANQHHNQAHGIVSSDHTVTGSQWDVVGLTGTNTLGILTPSYNPGPAAALLRTDASGRLELEYLTVRGWTATSTGDLRIGDPAPIIAFQETDQSGAGALWRLVLDGTKVRFESANDGDDFSLGSTIPIRITSAGQVELPVLGSSGGLLIGTDAQLYRTGVEQLRTNGHLTVDQHLSVGDYQAATNIIVRAREDAVDTTTSYFGVYSYVTKVAGITDDTKDLYGIYSRLELNQVGGIIGIMRGMYAAAILTAGTVSNNDMYGGALLASIQGGTVSGTEIYGGQLYVDIGSGSAVDVIGGESRVDAELAATINGDVYGHRIWIDDDASTTGTVYMLYLEEYTGIDYGIYQAGTAPHYLGGKVGLGAASPVKTLEAVAGAVNDFAIVASKQVDVNQWVGIGIRAYTAGTGAIKSGIVKERTTTYGRGKIHFLNNNTADDSSATLTDSVVVIDAAGNVGVGAQSPFNALHIAQDQPSIRLSDTDATTDMEVSAILCWYRGENTNRVSWIGHGNTTNDYLQVVNEITDADIYLKTTGAGNVVVSNGNALVGLTTAVGGKLEVRSTTEQARFEYDAADYASLSVSSIGTLTMTATGSAGSIIIRPAGTLYLEAQGSGVLVRSDQYDNDFIVQDGDQGSVNYAIWYRYSTGTVYLGNTDAADPEVQVRGALQVINDDGSRQFEVAYDGSNKATWTVSSGGNLTIAPSGGQANLTGDLDVSSHIAVGAAAGIGTTSIVNVAESFTGSSNAVYAVNNYDPTASYADNVYGIHGQVQVGTAQTRTGGEISGIRGVARFDEGIAGIDAALQGGIFVVDVEDAAATVARGVLAYTPYVDTGSCVSGMGFGVVQGTVGTGSITTLYGLYVGTISAGGTNYSIYTNAGTVSLGDDLEFRQAVEISSTAGNMTFSPAGDVVFDPTGKDILPATGFDLNIGSLSKKYLTLHAAELWVETLVAQETMATIAGRILAGRTTYLTSDLAAAATTIYVQHNNLANGDRVVLEANGNVEWIAIASAASGTGPYSYTVTRNLDGSGANDWYAGDAVFDTGATNDGFIDIYSVAGVYPGSTAGPTVVGNIRNSATYNDFVEAWAIGNLNGLYGYGTDTYGAAFGKYSLADYLTIDPSNGIRFFDDGDVVRAQFTSGVFTLGAATTENIYITSTGVQIRDATTVYVDLTGTALTLGLSTAEHIVVDATGISLMDAAVVYGQFAATTIIGETTTEHVRITNAELQIKDGSAVLTEVSGGNVRVGALATENVNVTATAVQIRDGTTVYTELVGGVLILGDDGAADGYYAKIQASLLEFYERDTSADVIRARFNDGGLYLYDPTGSTVLTTVEASQVIVGASGAEHVVVDTSGVSLMDNTTVYGQFAATTTIGVTTTEHISISSTAVQIKADASTVLTDITGSAITLYDSGGADRLVLDTSGVVVGDATEGEYVKVSSTTGFQAYDSGTEWFRVGDLNGNWGYSSSTLGMAIGEYGSGKTHIISTGGVTSFYLYTAERMRINTAGLIRIGDSSGSNTNVTITDSQIQMRSGTSLTKNCGRSHVQAA